MGGGGGKQQAKGAVSLRIIDDLDQSFQFPAPKSLPQLVTSLADHYKEPEAQLQCYTSGFRPIASQADYDTLLQGQAVLRIRLMASLSEYLESVSQTFGQDFTVEESEEQPAGPFLVSPAQGYMQVWAIGSGEYRRQTAPFLDIHSRVAVTGSGEMYLSGGSNKPDLFCCVHLNRPGLRLLPALFKGRGDHSMCLHHSAIVVLGGFAHRPLANCQSFEEVWTPLPALTRPRYGHSCVSTSESLYVIGGVRSTCVEQLRENGYWRELEVDLPLAHPGVVLTEDGELLIVGGGSPRAQTKVFALDIDTWESSDWPDLPRPDTFRSPGLQWEEQVYLIGTTGRYTLKDGQWSQL